MTPADWHDPTLYMTAAAMLAVLSGLPSALRLLSPPAGQHFSIFTICAASLLGLGAALTTLVSGAGSSYSLNLLMPFGPHTVRLDPVSALFALPILIVAACSSLYSSGYFPANAHPRTTRKITLFFGLLVGSLLGILLAGSSGLFLFCWEIMAVSAYFVVTTDDDQEAVRSAGTLYLICTHIGTLALFALFSLLAATWGDFSLPPAGSLKGTTPTATALVLLAIFGFSFKAGAMPLHVWLPGAHANAPSHISALMSGVILKIGVYGLVRTLSFFYEIPLWWGVTILILGVVSGVIGVVFAIGQHDLKRLLAYHSIENIGIIYIGIGIALIGIANASPLLVLLGMGGALLHVLNHALFKGLLFLGAGSVIHAIGTREIERMGGLVRRMPRSTVLFLIGAVAICGLPPLNGFVSELLIYLGLFNGVMDEANGAAILGLAAPLLALIGGLAVACFVKVFGVVFLGAPRSEAAAQAHEAPGSMLVAMTILALCCGLIGLVPILIAPLIQAAVTTWHPVVAVTGISLTSSAPLGLLSLTGILLLTVILISLWLFIRRTDSAPATETWGCGYLVPTSRMQYSASSFAEMLVGLFSGLLLPHQHQPTISGPFPKPDRFESHLPETVLERLYLPFMAWANRKLGVIRHLQHGHLHLYILYILFTLLVLLSLSF